MIPVTICGYERTFSKLTLVKKKITKYYATKAIDSLTFESVS